MNELEYHALCDHCGDLLVYDYSPIKHEPIHCDSCGVDFPDGLEDSGYPWREWPKDGPTDWAGCA